MRAEARIDGRQQSVDALAGQRGHQHGRPIAARPIARSASARAGRVQRSALFHTSSMRASAAVGIDAEVGQHRLHVAALRLGLGVADVAHVQDEVGLDHLLQRGAEGRDQRGRQVGDEADGVGQDRCAGRSAACTSRMVGIERREHLVAAPTRRRRSGG